LAFGAAIQSLLKLIAAISVAFSLFVDCCGGHICDSRDRPQLHDAVPIAHHDSAPGAKNSEAHPHHLSREHAGPDSDQDPAGHEEKPCTDNECVQPALQTQVDLSKDINKTILKHVILNKGISWIDLISPAPQRAWRRREFNIPWQVRPVFLVTQRFRL
jgi:hypothetical protein